jgi:sugar fermentation stimulation protein A
LPVGVVQGTKHLDQGEIGNASRPEGPAPAPEDSVLQTSHELGEQSGLSDPGIPVWLSRSSDPKRKLPLSLELVEVDLGRGPSLVGINTGYPNRLVAEALAAGQIPELAGYSTVRREVRYGRASRVDFVLDGDGRPPCYLEVKNVHLMRRPGHAEFPDAVTARGTRHLSELSEIARNGGRAVMLFVVQRDDAEAMGLAGDIDPAYQAAFEMAQAAGVETLVYGCDLCRSEIAIARPLPFVSPAPARR